MAKITEHFTEEEMYCKCKRCVGKKPPADVQANLKRLCQQLELFRTFIAKTLKKDVGIKVLSGYRCKAHNADVGGSPTSNHMRGEAVDITFGGLSSEELFKIASGGLDHKQAKKGVKPKGMFSGVGYYPGQNFTHVDITKGPKRPATWEL